MDAEGMYQEAAANRVTAKTLAEAREIIEAANKPTLVVFPPLSLGAEDLPTLQALADLGRGRGVLLSYDEADLIQTREQRGTSPSPRGRDDWKTRDKNMHEFIQQSRKYGTQITDESGRVVALHGIVKLGDRAIWLGRKGGKDTYDHLFEVGEAYEVCMIYPSNGDLLLQGSDPAVTIRAGRSEYSLQS